MNHGVLDGQQDHDSDAGAGPAGLARHPAGRSPTHRDDEDAARCDDGAARGSNGAAVAAAGNQRHVGHRSSAKHSGKCPGTEAGLGRFGQRGAAFADGADRGGSVPVLERGGEEGAGGADDKGRSTGSGVGKELLAARC